MDIVLTSYQHLMQFYLIVLFHCTNLSSLLSAETIQRESSQSSHLFVEVFNQMMNCCSGTIPAEVLTVYFPCEVIILTFSSSLYDIP